MSVATLSGGPPIIIAHRGASGERPEHTLAAYQLAIEQGADFIEPDLVLSKDGILVVRHENEISETTNVADKSEFSDRKTVKMIDGERHEGWFTEDFTLAELRTLRAEERIPSLRPANARFDGLYPVPTFDEIVALAAAESERRIRPMMASLKYPALKRCCNCSAHTRPTPARGLESIPKPNIRATLRRWG